MKIKPKMTLNEFRAFLLSHAFIKTNEYGGSISCYSKVIAVIDQHRSRRWLFKDYVLETDKIKTVNFIENCLYRTRFVKIDDERVSLYFYYAEKIVYIYLFPDDSSIPERDFLGSYVAYTKNKLLNIHDRVRMALL